MVRTIVKNNNKDIITVFVFGNINPKKKTMMPNTMRFYIAFIKITICLSRGKLIILNRVNGFIKIRHNIGVRREKIVQQFTRNVRDMRNNIEKRFTEFRKATIWSRRIKRNKPKTNKKERKNKNKGNNLI